MTDSKNIEIKNCPIEIANDIWNSAIEVVAEYVNDKANRDGSYDAIISANEIIQIWVKNGKTGRHAAFRLQVDTQKELMDWLDGVGS